MILAVATLCIGFYLSIRMAQAGQELVATMLNRIFYFAAVAVVVKYTFTLGISRGFPVGQADGSIHFGNLLRNLVATLVVLGCLSLLAGPFMAAIAQAAR